MSKIKINHFENATISWVKSVELDTEILSKCEPSFDGDTAEEFISFMDEVDIQDFCDNNEEILGSDLVEKIIQMSTLEDKVQVYDSSDNGSDETFEDGEDDLYAFEVGSRDE